MNQLTQQSISAGIILLAALSPACLNAADPGKMMLGFRMQEFSTVHMHDAAAAEKHIKTLKALKCEVSSTQHDGHTDIKCRTGTWKLLALDTDEKVFAWTKWMQDNGFQTLYSRQVKGDAAPPAKGKEMVQYRSAEWKTLHLHGAVNTSNDLAIYQALGCKTEKSDHSGHTDLRVSCPEWREIELPDHKSASDWETHLKKLGFEVKHQHNH